MTRTAQYQPRLAWFAALGSAWVFVLVALGAFTTSIGAGMAFADWPLSNGSVNPQGWLTDISMFAEHSHRLSGTTMGLITMGLAYWLWRCEERAWVRKLGYWAVGIVITQGLIGGKRVLFDSLAVPGFEMTLGQMLRIPHGILAHIFVCVLFAIAASLSKQWIDQPAVHIGHSKPATRRLGRWCVGLIVAQLWIAAAMRHNYAGLAIPTFPWSTPDGALLPAFWDYRVVLHFAHRVMAVILTVAILWYVWALWLDKGLSKGLRIFGMGLIMLLGVQISLGAQIIWSFRNAYITTGHVLIGALTLAITFLITFLTHRNVLDPTTDTRA